MAKHVVALLAAMVAIKGAEGFCYTAWGAPGQCVNIKSCEPLLKLLRPRPIAAPVFRVLRKAQCGFDGLDPKVCCQTVGEDSRDDFRPTRTKNYNYAEKITTKTMAAPATTPAPPPPPLPVYRHPNRRLLGDERCGPIPEGRIYGGNVTSIYEFPWMALLGYGAPSDPVEFRCGGSLISARYVLTAAHCTAELPEDLKLSRVRVGEHDLGRERDCDSWENGIGYNCAAKYQDFGIERVDVHPDFTRRKLHNDISLVRLSSPADVRPASVRPICLPLGQATLLKSRKAVVTGWGSTEFGTRSQRLLKVTLPIVGTEECDKAYRYQMVKIWHKQICAGGADKMDSCSGDSGGPLQAVGIYNGEPRNVIYGIVSFGPHSCGVEGFPGVYTSVAHYVDWILDTITD